MTIYTYFPNIPNPPDAPADDVASMQTNSASIAGIIGVDHVGFGSSGNGQHKQVTFNANNVPTLPTTFPALFTNVPTSYGGTPNYAQLFFYSGSASQSANQYVLTGTGSVLLLGGIILKWGTVTIPNGAGSQPGSFSPSFPNNSFSLVFTPGPNTVAGDFPFYSTFDPGGFVCNRVGGNTGHAVTYSYIAIGN